MNATQELYMDNNAPMRKSARLIFNEIRGEAILDPQSAGHLAYAKLKCDIMKGHT